MKKVLLSFVAFVIATVCVAQGSLIATLSHDGNITTFYGTQAWRSAHDAAVHGDVITLSSGTFIATNITKAVTVRGAGMGIDPKVTVEPTVISGSFNINIADSVTSRLTLEGIYSNHTVTYMNVKNPLFLKCRFNAVTSNSSSTSILKDASFIHCRVAEYFHLANNSSAMCINSVINEPYSSSSSTSVFDFQNCVVRSYSIGSIQTSSFKNCIVINITNNNLDSNNTAYNCVAIPFNCFRNITNTTNKSVADYATLFKTYKGADFDKLDNETFELTETAQKEYLGMDGTEVGVYGGALPYDPTPSNPQITKCNVAAKSTADGKLSVDIEVNTAE